MTYGPYHSEQPFHIVFLRGGGDLIGYLERPGKENSIDTGHFSTGALE